MTEQTATAPNMASMPASTPEPTERRCPWCSQLLPPSATDKCPSCRANLVATAAEAMPGLTEVESDTATRVRRADAPKRSKLLAWISGDIDEEAMPPSEAASEAFAPPSKDVRREIWRLTLEAEGLEVLPDGEIVVPGAAPESSDPAETPTPVTAGAPAAVAASTPADASAPNAPTAQTETAAPNETTSPGLPTTRGPAA